MGVALVVAGAVTMVMLAVGGYLLRGSRRSDEPAVHHARCPKCDQKVRYSPERAGRQVMCPRCRRRWMLPETAQPLPAASGRALRRGSVLRGVEGSRA